MNVQEDKPKNDVFDILQKVITRLKPIDKFCILLFEEFSLNVEVKENQIARDNPPNCCYSFMLRGMNSSWKQPILNCLLRTHQKTPDRIAQIIKDAIQNSLRSGLTIVATVSQANKVVIDAIEILRKESFEFLQGMKQFTGEYDESYVVDCNIIHHIYDPCRLLRTFRNQLMEKNLIFEMNGKKCKASWQAILQALSIDKSKKRKQKLTKIGLEHIILNSSEMLLTSRAAQVLSDSVGNVILRCVESGESPREYEDTALLILFLDKLFDSCNADSEYRTEEKPYREPIKTGSPHFQLWDAALVILDSMRFVNSTTGLVHRPKCIDRWACTVQGFKNIWKIVHKSKMKYLYTRRFNVDVINNMMQILHLMHKQSAQIYCESSDAPILDLDILKIVVTSEYGYYEIADEN